MLEIVYSKVFWPSHPRDWRIVQSKKEHEALPEGIMVLSYFTCPICGHPHTESQIARCKEESRGK